MKLSWCRSISKCPLLYTHQFYVVYLYYMRHWTAVSTCSIWLYHYGAIKVGLSYYRFIIHLSKCIDAFTSLPRDLNRLIDLVLQVPGGCDPYAVLLIIWTCICATVNIISRLSCCWARFENEILELNPDLVKYPTPYIVVHPKLVYSFWLNPVSNTVGV